MAPRYKISYFDFKALGEPIRMLLSYGKVEFEDDRVSLEKWPQIKANTPFGQLPILEVDGKIAQQSVAIERYLAKKFGLVGSNDWEDLEIDSMVDTLNDLRIKISKYGYEQDPTLKESFKEPLLKETMPYYLTRLETIAKNNNEHLACGKLTWADFVLAGLIDYMNFLVDGENILEKYPKLQQVVDNVLKIPQVKQWVEKRPKTPM